MTPIYVVIALIGGGAIAAVALDRRRCRGAAARPAMTHPSMRKFRDGPMPRHEDSPLTLAEEQAFSEIAAAEHAWIGDAVKGRSEGERS